MIGSVWTFSVRIDKLPVLLGAIAGLLLAIWLAPRRALLPLVGAGAAVRRVPARGRRRGVGDRPLPAGRGDRALLFCAVAVGGWSMLEPGSALRRVWIAGAAVLVVYGAASAATTISLSSLRTTLAYHEDFHKGLAVALHDPQVASVLHRCPLLSLPNNKLIPDARWILDSVGQHDIVARSQARADAEHGAPQLENALRRRQRRGLPAGQRRVRRGDRRRRRRSPRPGAREGLQAHLHEPLLRGLCQLLSPRRPAPTPAGAGRAGDGGGAGALVRARLGVARARGRAGGGLVLRLWGFRRGCRTSTTSTRPTTSCRTRWRCSPGHAQPALLRQPAGVHVRCCTSCSRSPTASGSGVVSAFAHDPAASTRSRGSPRRCSATLALWLLYLDRRAPVRPRPSGCWRRRSRRSRSCRSSTRTWRSTTCPRSRR